MDEYLFDPMNDTKNTYQECLSQLNKVNGGYEEKVKLREIEFAKGDDLKGEIKGTAVIFGKVDDRPLFIAKGAFDKQCGAKVPLLKGHQDGMDFVMVGSAKLRCGVHRLRFDAQFNLMRDPETKGLLIKEAGELLALTANGDLDGVSVGMNFSEDDVEFDKENGWMIVHKAEIQELSLVIFPAIEGARVTQVMNSEPKPEVIVNSCPCLTALGRRIDLLIGRTQNA